MYYFGLLWVGGDNCLGNGKEGILHKFAGGSCWGMSL